METALNITAMIAVFMILLYNLNLSLKIKKVRRQLQKIRGDTFERMDKMVDDGLRIRQHIKHTQQSIMNPPLFRAGDTFGGETEQLEVVKIETYKADENMWYYEIKILENVLISVVSQDILLGLISSLESDNEKAPPAPPPFPQESVFILTPAKDAQLIMTPKELKEAGFSNNMNKQFVSIVTIDDSINTALVLFPDLNITAWVNLDHLKLINPLKV